jgi:hypothetical protein
LNVHHIKGQLGNGTSTVNGAIPKRTGGIYFAVLGNTEQTNSKSREITNALFFMTLNYAVFKLQERR